MDYKKIFTPKTLAKLNRASAEHLRQMLGNKTLMQTLASSQEVLDQIQEAEAPYKTRLEALAIEMVKELYPIIDEQGIKIDAKISAGSNVNDTLDEITVNNPDITLTPGKEYEYIDFQRGKNIKQTIINLVKANPYVSEKQIYRIAASEGIIPSEHSSKYIADNLRYIPELDRKIVKNHSTQRPIYVYWVKSNIEENITPEARRRIINAVTQGAALRGAFAFYLFKEHLDEIDTSLIEKYNQIMKEVFGIYDDDNAIAMMLSLLAQGHKQAGGSSKVIINEITVNNPTDDYEIFFYEDSYLFNGKKVKGSLDIAKKLAEKELEKASTWRRGNYWANIYKKDLENPNNNKEIGRVKMGKDGWEHYSLTNEITVVNPKKIFTFKDDPNYGIVAGQYKVVGAEKQEDLPDELEHDEYELVNIKTGEHIFVSQYYAENNQTEQPLRESQSSGITIKARAICFPMLVHEIIKGLYELISLQGFKGVDKKANQDVVDKVDLLKNEPEDIKYGKFIYDALNGIFADSNYEDPRIREFFFTEIYRLGEKEFIAFIENAINEELTPQQQSWVKITLRDIADDLKADDRDALDEIKVNRPIPKFKDNQDMEKYFEANDDIKGEFIKKALANTRWDDKSIEEWIECSIETNDLWDDELYINDGDDNVIHFSLDGFEEITLKNYKIQLGPNIINVIYT